ncbi:LysR family transcriptional regulator [Paraburkholderia oxyphila]|uniref:LysR family transcriptional regulator n=1 Tax=Paraburkholderia oxyphila TaxID=614212 RepID=UPI0005B9A3E2|nr:LysR family transcriptional regulator [Paraburkholderia oxyphila]
MNINTVDLNLLKAFDAMMRERAVTRAGASIGLSQPAMSHALTRLRDIFNDELFVRTSRGMDPTARALALAVPIQGAIQELRTVLESNLPFSPATAHRTFSIGMTEYAEIALVAQLIATVREQGERIDLRLRGVTKDQYVSLLDDGILDIFIGHLDERHRRLHTIALLEDPLVLVASRNHPILSNPITIDSYVAWPHVLVSPTGEARGPVDSLLAKEGLKRRIATTVTTFLALPLALEQSDLIASIPRQVAYQLSDRYDLAIGRLPFEHLVESGMAWHERSTEDTAHLWLRQTIQSIATLGPGKRKSDE